MKLHYLLVATAVIAVGFGAAFMVIPSVLWALYGLQLTPEGVLVTRLFGAANVGIGLVLWFLRRAGPAAARAAGWGILCWSLLEALVLLAGQVAGLTNALGWSLVGFDVALVLAYGWLLLAPAKTDGLVSVAT